MDHLQTDIDSLENERGQLKEKLKSYGKKTTTTTSGAESTVGSTVVASTPTNAPLENKFLLQEVNALREALANEHKHKTKLLADSLQQKLNSLPPLPVVVTPKPSDSKIEELQAKRNALLKVSLERLSVFGFDSSLLSFFFTGNTSSDVPCCA